MFKSWIKSIYIILGVFLAQIIGVLITIFSIALFNIDWMYEVDEILSTSGVTSTEYFSKISEIIYPSLIISDILIMIPFIIVLVKRKENPFKNIVTKNEFLFIFSLGIVINTIISYIVSILPESSTTSDYNQLVNNLVNVNFIIALLVTGIIAPIVEEFVFRYAVIKYFRNRGVRRAIFISALLFGVAHLNIIQSSYAFVLGLLLGLIYTYKDNLIHSILFHISIKGSSIVYSYIPESLTFIAYIVIGLCSICCVYYLLRYRRCMYEVIK